MLRKYLKCGYVGGQEKFITRRYLENLEDETSIYVEKENSGRVKGQFFKKEEELLDETYYLDSYKTLDEYLEEQIVNDYADYILEDNCNINSETSTIKEKKEALKEYYENLDLHDNLYEALKNKKTDETIYVCVNGLSGNEWVDTDKSSLINQAIFDGQSSNAYETVEEAIECIKEDGYQYEELVVFLYNNMEKKEKEKYYTEYIEMM